MPYQTQIDAFTRAVIDHFGYSPSTWEVVKVADRVWQIAPPWADRGCGYDRFTTKREATQALLTQNSWGARQYWERDAWYRETSTDPRNRPLKDWEREIIARYITPPKDA